MSNGEGFVNVAESDKLLLGHQILTMLSHNTTGGPEKILNIEKNK